ncbi:MAG: EamA family transporter [Pseudonocardia sp.]|nr:EamA family transporter [Pseudonocardia sp.]
MPNRRVAWAALGVVYVLWGSTYLGNRLIITDVPPLMAGGVRFLVGGGLLAVVVALVAGARALRMTRAQLATTALSGLLLPAWGNGIVTLGQQQVSSGVTALLIAAARSTSSCSARSPATGPVRPPSPGWRWGWPGWRCC